MEKTTTLTFINANRSKIIVVVSVLGAGALLYLTTKILWTGGKRKEEETKRIDGVPLSLMKDEIARKRPKVKRQSSSTTIPTRLLAVKETMDGDVSQSFKVGLTDSESNLGLVSSLVDLAVGPGDLEDDALLLKAMSDLDSAINQLEQVMVSLNISKVPLLKNGITKDLTIESEINKLRYLLDVTTSSELSKEGLTSSTLTDSRQEDAKGYTMSYEEFALHRGLTDDDTLVNIETESVSSDDSFVSAAESLEAGEGHRSVEFREEESELDLIISGLKEKKWDLDLYLSAVEDFCQNGVSVRSVRTEMVDCDNDVDFCVKVHCLRQAFQQLLESQTIRQWFVELGKDLVGTMLKKMDRDYKAFEKDFDILVDYCECQENWVGIEDELTERGVCCMSFYDIILDFIVMDAFEDLENPPYAVTTAVQNRWLSDRIKETALTTAVWSILKAKKQMLTSPNGFLGKMYDVSQHVSPMLAWGFLGPVQDVRAICFAFKNAMVGFLEDIFSTDKVRYSSVSRLADDIKQIAEARRTEVLTKLS